MQNQNGVPRGAVLVISGAAAIAICYLSYLHFSQERPQLQAETKLHRSNAVRRRRRRWRQGYHPVELDYDPLARAFEHLDGREASGQGYGMYHNKYYVQDELLSEHGDSFVLLPSRLEHIRQTISQTHNLSNDVNTQLMIHIQAKFVQTFLKEEFPEGYMLNDDESSELAAKLEPEVDPDLLKNIVDLHGRGADIVEGDMWFTDESREEDSNQPQGPVGIAQALSGQDSGRTENNRAGTWREHEDEQGEGHNVLDLLYRIAEEQAKWTGYQHRGVECNGCGMQPIRGIRYHCANCWDYDLCETCEHQQIHHKTHVFYKIRIPAPTRGQIKLVQPKWYPGNPNACPESIPRALKMSLLRTTNLNRQDLDALYDQFKCIAGREWPEDPDEVCMAIDRPSFDRYFTSTTADRPPGPNLIYDRIFALYDHGGDGLINFSEFAKGMAELANNTSRGARIQRLFKAFDLDGDGYVSRRDFLFMLQAHYNLNKEIAHEIIYARDDALLTDEEIHEVIQGTNPISAAFGGNNFAGHQSRHGEGKHIDSNNDLVFDNEVNEILREDSRMTGNRAEAIARQASEARSLIQGNRLKTSQLTPDEPVVGGYHMPPIPTSREEDSIMGSPRSNDEGVDRLGHIADNWPTTQLQQEDVEQALGANVPLEDVMDPLDRRRIMSAQRDRLYSELEVDNLEKEESAVHDRWQKKEFYLDFEEGLTKPAGYHESDSSDEEGQHVSEVAQYSAPKPRPGSLSFRSRSSSKVRFDDSTIDNDMDTKSDASSRHTPVNERWGGFELSQPNRDVGVEIIYEAVQEAFNTMLNDLFKDKEDQAIEAKRSLPARQNHAAELDRYEKELLEQVRRKEEALLRADMERTEALLKPQTGEDLAATIPTEQPPTPEFPNMLERAAELTHASVASSGLNESSTQVTPGSEESIDPTLPQNRPNEISLSQQAEGVAVESQTTFSDLQLAVWHRHNLVDKEAEERGGYGRLNLKELKWKLRDEVSDLDVGSEEADEFWDAKADLGRFSFLSSWIEMASF